MANTAVQEFVNDLVSEIEQGIYDKHLRGIARACYRRRGQLEDGTGVVAQKEDGLQKPPEIVDPLPTTAEPPAVTNNTMRTAREVFAVTSQATAVEVPSGRRVGSQAFRWNGVRYWRSSINDHAIHLGSGTRPRKFANSTLLIDEVFVEGGSKVRATVLAADNDPRMVGDTVYLSRNFVMRQLVNGTV